MPVSFKSAQFLFNKPVVLKDNLGLPVSFSGVAYPVTNIVCRPDGVDFEYNKKIFRNVDAWELRIEMK